MRIGVLKEAASGERRVALTPDGAARLVRRGLEVVVEAGAGEGAWFSDEAYGAAGAIVADRRDVITADVVVAVNCPEPGRAVGFAAGTVLVSLLGPDPAGAVHGFNDRSITILALERVPRITRAQSMDVLSSQATVSGYQAVLLGCRYLPRFLPMLTTAAGSIQPARVLVLGAGVAGLQAIATARRLGAIVSGFDIRAAAAEQVQSLGARFIAPGTATADAETAGGYARELGHDRQQELLQVVAAAVAESDMVIATAAVPGRPAPVLVTRAMVESMKPGSVIVDVAATTGGNCELTVAGEVRLHGDVTIAGPLDLPATLPQHASQMFSRNIQSLVEHLTPEGKLVIDLDDEITGAMCLAHQGALRQGE